MVPAGERNKCVSVRLNLSSSAGTGDISETSTLPAAYNAGQQGADHLRAEISAQEVSAQESVHAEEREKRGMWLFLEMEKQRLANGHDCFPQIPPRPSLDRDLVFVTKIPSGGANRLRAHANPTEGSGHGERGGDSGGRQESSAVHGHAQRAGVAKSFQVEGADHGVVVNSRPDAAYMNAKMLEGLDSYSF